MTQSSPDASSLSVQTPEKCPQNANAIASPQVQVGKGLVTRDGRAFKKVCIWVAAPRHSGNQIMDVETQSKFDMIVKLITGIVQHPQPVLPLYNKLFGPH